MNFHDTLIKSAKCLQEVKEKKVIEDFVLIGALALARVSVPRATADIDYAIRLGKKSLDDVALYLKGEARHGDIFDPLLGCVSFSIDKSITSIPIQLILLPKGLEEVAFLEAERIMVSDIEIPFASSKALLLLKLYAGSPLDLQDAENLIIQSKFSDADINNIKKLASKLRISGRLKKVVR